MPTSSSRRGARFVLVGLANTAIDFGVLVALSAVGAAPVAANLASTSAALAFSFAANRRFTFRASGDPVRQLVLFLAVTLTGLWVIQSALIHAIGSALAGSGLPELLVLTGAKGVATVASLVWNYVLYARIVFREAPQQS
ncbi:GtrA family protein [Demequina mangrovi]|uniref:Putative flippase GtrA (Transmembrane translocase of bactoprenol-linked glucose) n=1 Tax=Demequina mangrovi TaxID=1043493 RepID=A0A1H7A228_9MICO|nr:GtrA family protein [Demequina mangrovi]SEJ59538.1 Putative flippase GtrA (transmembrane translocase of bactoprenol-linked glucose) [Demequina mangrovi]